MHLRRFRYSLLSLLIVSAALPPILWVCYLIGLAQLVGLAVAVTEVLILAAFLGFNVFVIGRLIYPVSSSRRGSRYLN